MRRLRGRVSRTTEDLQRLRTALLLLAGWLHSSSLLDMQNLRLHLWTRLGTTQGAAWRFPALDVYIDSDIYKKMYVDADAHA